MRGIHVLARVIPVVLVVGVLAFVGFTVVPDLLEDDRPEIPDAPALADWPAEVRPFVRYVERERGLRFRRLVEIDFLAPAEFEKAVTDDEGDLTDEDRQEIEETTGFLRALGLIEDDVDLFDASQDLLGAGVLGLYSFDDELIRVRGSELGLSVQVTLVHELTHALQDQHFDIGDRFEELEKSDEESGASRASAFQALVEGDASRVESSYVASLSKGDRAAYQRAQTADRETFRGRAADVPPVLVTLLGAPYALGERLVDQAVALDGDDAADDLFDDPPTTDEHLLDPWTLLVEPRTGTVVETAVPPVGEGEEEFDSGEFGALGWYVVLAQRLDPKQALRATDGWGGDAYSAFRREGRTCVRIAFRGDTRRDVEEMGAALDDWIAASPGAALLQRTRDGLVFASCESDAEPPAKPQDTILQLPVVRSVILNQALEQGAPQTFARCYSQRVVEDLTLAEINSDDAAVADKARALAAGCTGPGAG